YLLEVHLLFPPVYDETEPVFRQPAKLGSTRFARGGFYRLDTTSRMSSRTPTKCLLHNARQAFRPRQRGPNFGAPIRRAPRDMEHRGRLRWLARLPRRDP